MSDYRDILHSADRHFAEVARNQPEQLQCGKGCSFCCYGLFEIGSGDVAVIVDALRALTPAKRAKLVARAAEIVEKFEHPNIREIEEEEKEAFFERTASVACPALGNDGACQIYENRPLVCRTFGLPIRDGKKYIGDICDLNFKSASDAKRYEAAWDLQDEDPVSAEDQYTIPEAILIASRIVG